MIVPVIMTTIYILALVNTLLVILLFLLKLKDGIRVALKKRNDKLYDMVERNMLSIESGESTSRAFQKQFRKKHKIFYEIMLEVVRKNGTDFHHSFDVTGNSEEVLNRLKHARIDEKLDLLRQLSLIKTPKAIEILVKIAKTDDSVSSYRAAIALSNIKMDNCESARIIYEIIGLNFNRGRIIEIISKFDVDTESLLFFLKLNRDPRKQTILLNVLKSKATESDIDAIINALENYVVADKETYVAAIELLGKIKCDRSFDAIVKILNSASPWEVRAKAAKILSGFDNLSALNLLRELAKDEVWWVRFNALESLARLGRHGLDVLIDFVSEKEKSEVSDLAYQIINSNVHVFDTVRNIGESK